MNKAFYSKKDEPFSPFGKMIYEYRQKHSLTQQQLADILQVHRIAIIRYESDKIEPHFNKKTKLIKRMEEYESNQNHN